MIQELAQNLKGKKLRIEGETFEIEAIQPLQRIGGGDAMFIVLGQTVPKPAKPRFSPKLIELITQGLIVKGAARLLGEHRAIHLVSIGRSEMPGQRFLAKVAWEGDAEAHEGYGTSMPAAIMEALRSLT